MDQAPDQTTPEAAPVTATPAAASAPEPKKNTAYGTILGIILIVAILVVGAFYVWGERLQGEQPTPEAAENAAGGSIQIDATPQPN